MTFEKWYAIECVKDEGWSEYGWACMAWEEATKQGRGQCAGIAESFCHCPEAYGSRDLIDPTCDCHDIAAAIREAE